MTATTRPRWRRFVWQGAIIALAGLVAVGVGDGPLGGVIIAVGALLLLAGLIGGAVQRDGEDVGPSA
jgi:hypothetical protein